MIFTLLLLFRKEYKRLTIILIKMPNTLEEIKNIRKKLGLTQSQLAKKSGLSQSLIAKVEAGTLDPTYKKAQQLFQALDDLQKKEEVKAKEIMYKKIITVDCEDNVINAVKKMKKHGISQLPVLQNDAPVGLISESTIINAISSNKDLSKLKVCDVMKECPPIITPNARKSFILDMLKHYSIVLVADKGKLKGLISKADVLDSIYS